MSATRIIFADQYNLPCVSVENPDMIDPNDLIAQCEQAEAYRTVDGLEYCVELRDVGPELWTEEALRRSVGKGLRC